MRKNNNNNMSDKSNTEVQKMSNVEFEKLSDVQKMYVKRFERLNKSRAAEHVGHRSRQRKWGAFFVATVFGIYVYSMWAVRQEKLGEEYDQRYADTLKKSEETKG